MSDYRACPRCGREAQNNLTSNWFPVYECTKCDTRYCYECDDSHQGHRCPRCHSSSHQQVGKVYARSR